MANISTAASGNWSSTATWSGGVLPGPADTAQVLTGHTVTIDQDISVTNLNNTGTGKFVLTGATPYTLDVSGEIDLGTSPTSALLVLDASYSATGTVINTGQITPTAYQATGATATIDILAGATGSATINVVGNIEGDNNGTGDEPPTIKSQGAVDLNISAAMIKGYYFHTIYILGSANCDITVNCPAIRNRAITIEGTGTHLFTMNGKIINDANNHAVMVSNPNTEIIMNGDITGPASTTGYYSLYAGNSSHITVNGNIDLTGQRSGGVYIAGGSVQRNVTINGNVIGPAFQNARALNLYRADGVVTGTITGGSGMTTAIGSGGVGVYLEYMSQLIAQGDVYGGTATILGYGGPAIQASATNYVSILGDVYSANSTGGYWGGVVYDSGSPSPIVLGEADQVTHLYNTSSQAAMSATRYFIAPGAKVVYHFGSYDAAGNFTDSVTPLTNADSDFDPSDVRDGVTYDSDSKVGTMDIPDPVDVLYGVPVDNTIGTSSIKLTDAAAITGSQIATLSS